MHTKINKEEAEAIMIVIAGVFAIVLISIIVSKLFKAGSSVLEKIGAKADEATKDAAANIDKAAKQDADKGTSSPWNPGFYKLVAPDYLKPVSINKFVKDLSKMVYDGIGVFYDSPATITAAFKKVNSQAGLSALSDVFSQQYNYDLFNFLKEKLDTPAQIKEFNTILQYVAKLPKMA